MLGAIHKDTQPTSYLLHSVVNNDTTFSGSRLTLTSAASRAREQVSPRGLPLWAEAVHPELRQRVRGSFRQPSLGLRQSGERMTREITRHSRFEQAHSWV